MIDLLPHTVSNGKISILLHGPQYPPISGPSQTLNVTIECAQDDETPILQRWDENGALVWWKTKVACQTANEPNSPPSDDGPRPPHTGSGLGWFFIMSVLSPFSSSEY